MAAADTAATRLQWIRYQPELAPQWNHCVDHSRNGTFLLRRDFMDYHAHRHQDCSWLALRQSSVVAVLPAHRHERTLLSHGGLSYGGLILSSQLGLEDVLALLLQLKALLPTQQLDTLEYKCIPAMYHRWPAEDDRQALSMLGAQLVRCDPLSVIPPGAGAQPSTLRRRQLRRARQTMGLELRDDPCWAAYWPLLQQVLADRHGVEPVHSLAEIELLAGRFPAHIRLLSAWVDGRIAAGTLLFDTDRVLHAQYFASNALGRQQGLLDLLIERAIDQAMARGQWFDFGISSEDQGRRINAGLLSYKESFGARTVVQQFYRLQSGTSG